MVQTRQSHAKLPDRIACFLSGDVPLCHPVSCRTYAYSAVFVRKQPLRPLLPYSCSRSNPAA